MLVLSSSSASRVLKEKGFGEKDGVIYVDPMKGKSAGEKVVRAIEEIVPMPQTVCLLSFPDARIGALEERA